MKKKGAVRREKKGSGVLLLTSWPVELCNPVLLYHYRDRGSCLHPAVCVFFFVFLFGTVPSLLAALLSVPPSSPGNGHNWKNQTNSWMTGVKGQGAPRGKNALIFLSSAREDYSQIWYTHPKSLSGMGGTSWGKFPTNRPNACSQLRMKYEAVNVKKVWITAWITFSLYQDICVASLDQYLGLS